MVKFQDDGPAVSLITDIGTGEQIFGHAALGYCC